MLVGRRSGFGSARGQGGHLAADRGILNGTLQNVWATGPAWPMARRSRHEPEHVGSLDGDGLDDGRGRLDVEKGVLLRVERELPSLLRFGAPRQGGAVPGETSQVDGPLYIISRVSIGCQGQRAQCSTVCPPSVPSAARASAFFRPSAASDWRLSVSACHPRNSLGPTRTISKAYSNNQRTQHVSPRVSRHLRFSDSEIRCCPAHARTLRTLLGPRDPVRRVPSESSHAASGLLHGAKVLLTPALTSFEAP